MKKICSLLLLGAMLLSLAACGEPASAQPETHAPIPTPTAEPTPTPTPVVYTSDVDSLTDLFAATADDGYTDASVTYDETIGYVVSYTPGMAMDETDFIRSAWSDYINFCRKAFEIDGVTAVDFLVNTDMTDARGNTSSEMVMSFGVPYDTFNAYDWENMEYKSLYPIFYDDCGESFIHPGIWKNVDTDKLYYKGEK